MSNILPINFFNRSPLQVAPDLLGCTLVHQTKLGIFTGEIKEVEAYDGLKDKACHAHFSRTKKSETLFNSAGYWYTYYCYGIHILLNITTGAKEYPACVLLRTVGSADGPGKLTKQMNISMQTNGLRATKKNLLYITQRDKTKKYNYKQTPRIGLNKKFAKEWYNKPYRYVLI